MVQLHSNYCSAGTAARARPLFFGADAVSSAERKKKNAMNTVLKEKHPKPSMTIKPPWRVSVVLVIEAWRDGWDALCWNLDIMKWSVSKAHAAAKLWFFLLVRGSGKTAPTVQRYVDRHLDAFINFTPVNKSYPHMPVPTQSNETWLDAETKAGFWKFFWVKWN